MLIGLQWLIGKDIQLVMSATLGVQVSPWRTSHWSVVGETASQPLNSNDRRQYHACQFIVITKR